ncbi:MAG: patatin-like phospholipase family protein [Clostridia bacterium]|nr:patatin-like phospholipase family protein [Clostridia bacterium]
MYGLVLEGGGARGAYQIGAVKALFENGYEIGAITGTSIGAINGAMIAQGDFDLAYKLWKDISFSKIMDVDQEKLSRVLKKSIDFGMLKYLSTLVRETISNGGINTSKMRELFKQYIDEDKIRNSNIEFGLVTVCITDRKPLELFIENITKGSLIDYLMASARLPIFKSEAIENKHYLDGGFYNNCPINMLHKKCYNDIIIVRTSSKGRIRDLKKIKKSGANIILISPVSELQGIMNFDNKTLNEMIKLGYYDALKVIKGLEGINSYIEPVDEKSIFKALCNYNFHDIVEISNELNINLEMDEMKLLIEKIIPSITSKLGYKNVATYKQSLYIILEYISKKEEIDLLKVYKLKELILEIQNKIKTPHKKGFDKAIYKFVKHFNTNNLD